MKKLILLTLFTTALTVSFTKPAFADGLSFQVSPTLIKITSLPGEYIKTPITIKNLSKNPLKLKVLVERLNPAERDSTLEADVFTSDGGRLSLRSHDSSEVDKIELAPLQKKDLTLYLNVPKININKDYYFSILFISNQEDSQGEALSTQVKDVEVKINNVKAGLGLNVLLSVGQKFEAKGVLETFETPLYFTKGPVPFKVTIGNHGANVISPKGEIYITNMFGQTIGQVKLDKMNVLAGASNLIQPLWNENFLLGFYTAKIRLEIPNNELVYEKNIRFFAFPLEYIAITTISLLFILLIILRARKHSR